MASDREPDAVAEAADALYAADPADFLQLRGELVTRARAAGDADAARAVAALRKPTAAAWIVNRYVLTDPDCVGRLMELNLRLRKAHTELDADALRDLTLERRAVVDELTRAALAGAGRGDAGTSVREDVSSTFDAALADPEIAGRLGRLQRAEHWSGFGVAAGDLPAGSPALRLVRGGRDPGAARTAPGTKGRGRAAPSKEDRTAARADERERRQVLRKATEAFEAAEHELADAEEGEQSARERVGTLRERLADLERELDAATGALDDARRAAKSARARRREARAALDRAERNAPSD